MKKWISKQQKRHISIAEVIPKRKICYLFSAHLSCTHISRRLIEVKWEESKEELIKLGKKSKHSYRYDLVKRGGNSAVMGAKMTIAARFYQLKSGHALIAKYLLWIGKRRDMKCWWCGHEYPTRDHLFKWCKRWK